MRNICLGFAAAALVHASAFAQAGDAVSDRLAACRGRDDPNLRLACFDALAAEAVVVTQGAAGPVAPGQIGASGNWIVSRRPDTLSDQQRIVANLRGDTPPGPGLREPVLMISCTGTRLEVTAMPGDFVGSGTVRARLRFDRASPFLQTWRGSATGVSVSSPDPSAFVGRLLRSHRVEIEVANYIGATVRASFDPGGMSDILPELKTCLDAAPSRPQAASR